MLVRLWLFTPRPLNSGPNINPENIDYPEGGTYDTSVLDTEAEQCSDPRQFLTFQQMLGYATPRGEVLQKVGSAQEAFALCSPQRLATVPAVPAYKPSIVCQRRISIDQSEVQSFEGLVCPPGWIPYSIPASVPQPGPIKSGGRAEDLIPSLTPPPMGTPNQVNAIDSGGSQFMDEGQVYRLILFTPRAKGTTDNPENIDYPEGGTWDTGASYPLCSRSNTDACRPIQFLKQQDAINFATSHGEIPVRVNNVDDVWAIIEGAKPIEDHMILSDVGMGGLGMLAIGAAALFVLPKLFKKRS